MKKSTDCISYEDAILRFTYDPITGIFIDKTLGKEANYYRTDGYVSVYISDRQYVLAHRLAFLLVEGAYPESSIDHINNDRSNNKFNNLRKVTPSQNNHNAAIRKDSITGVKGVYWSNREQRYVGRIRVNKRTYYAGYFQNLLEAEQAIKTLRESLVGEFANHG